MRLAILFAAFVTAATPCVAAERVLVPSRIIYPGETVEANALQELTLVEGAAAPANVAVTMAELQGKVAKRTLLPGRYVAASALRDAFLIDKGAAVEVVFVAGALVISTAAVSLTPGSAGDEIKVRNIDTGKILTGTIMADGTVRVGG